MSGDLVLEGCRLLGSQRRHRVAIENGVIAEIGPMKREPSEGRSIDARGGILAPGFVDLHVQGAGGADVLDGTPAALCTISRTCARFGVTGFLATTVYRPETTNDHLTVASRAIGTDLGGARLLGIHLEGPFIAPEKRGMIQPTSISPPELALLRRILRLTGDGLRMMTIAPELKGCGPVLKLLVKSGCIASLGHSNATYEEAVEALAGDITHVTHLFNAMPLLHHRQPGPILAIMESRATVQVIPDGVHLHPRVLRWAWDQLGEDRMNLITDGIRATGLPEGEYEYDGVKFRAIEGAARYQNGTLIGTTLGMDELVRRAVRYTGCTLEEGIGMASRNPARVLGLADRKGVISEGRDADLVLLDQEGVRLTIVSGRVVHERS